MGSLDIVVGGQFGSEAKGHVTKQVLNMRMRTIDAPSHYYVNYRVAGPNAGHCVWDESDNKYALRTIPVGAVFPYVELVIAPGSEIDPEVLFSEIAELELGSHAIAGRLHISAEATVLTAAHKATEVGMQERMGSTGKGIGAARADRLMRTANRVGDDEMLVKMIEDVGGRVYHGMHPFDDIHDRCVVIEGTQGYGLGLHAGFYPQCTSSDTRAIDFAAMAGLNPWDFSVFAPWIVARVYPIRVAGNSGPLKGESSWEDLGLPQEFTTVTKKVRRVGEWDADLVEAAIRANGHNSRVAITMLDQKFSSVQGLDNHEDPRSLVRLEDEVIDFLADLPGVAPGQVHLVTTSEDTAVWL